jgi:hypothetical protein
MMNDTLDKLMVEAFDQRIQSARDLIDTVGQHITTDPHTRRVHVRDQKKIADAFRVTWGSDSEEVAHRFVAFHQDGLAVFHSGTEKEFSMPWRALFHEPTLASITAEGWSLLGIKPWSRTDSIRKTLVEKFPNVPARVLEDATLDSLANWAARREWHDRMSSMRAMGGDPPGTGLEGGGAPGPGGGLPPANPSAIDPAIAAIAGDIGKLVSASADCLFSGQWSITEWGVSPFLYSIGPKVCLDKKCADAIQTALENSAGSELSRFLQSPAAGLASSSIPAAVAAIGGWGWFGLALLHFALHWALWIKAKKTANGVCLTFFWPWNSVIAGGIQFGLPVINGYAEGR